MTPSISLYSFDWVVYPGWRSDEHLIIRSSDGGFQVDISARPIWLQNATEPTRIVITAAILSDGTVAMAYTLSGPEYPEANPRTGIRLNNGTVVDFETYGIEETEETPVLAPEPTEEAPFNPPPPPPPAPSLNAPTNVAVTQLQDGSVQVTWDAPTPTSTSVERYAISWSTDNFQQNGWGWNHDQTSVVIPRDILAQYGGLDNDFQFRIRADNNTVPVYSEYSNTASLFIASPAPTIPEGAEVYNEGSLVEIVAPEGQRIASAVGYYGDPNDSRRGQDVSSILFNLVGETSATVEVSNTTFQNDPAPGTPKILILLIVYEDIPVQPTPPAISEQPIVTPPEEEPVIEPSPEPTTIPSEEKPTPEPTPSEEPVKEPEEIEPEPLPEPEPSSPSEELGELTEIAPEDLTDEQVEQLVAAAEAILEVAEPGSEEYEQALDALMIAAQADDLELPTELAAIPLLGDVAGAVLDIFNDLGNVGSDMSPKVREKAEDVVVVSVIVAQVVSVTSLGAMASTSIRRP